MDHGGLNHISLVQGLSDNYIRRRASKDAENWKTLADVFESIAKIVRTAGKIKACNEPRYEKPLISILYLTILIIAKEDLLTDTKAPIK